MAPRSSWKGFLRLSLVSVPVKAFTASESGGEVHLNQLHKDCNNRIKYQKTCPEHGEVSTDQIVSGYEYTKGQYVVIDPEELQKIRTQSDRAISIQGFVPSDAVDPIYYAGRTYYLTPDGAAGAKPYALLRQGMVDAGVHALAQMVLSNREHLVLVRPQDSLLLMTLLHHHAEVKGLEVFRDEVKDQPLTADEMALTKTLIEATRVKEFDFSAYKDRYVEQLNQLIQLKVDGQEVVQVADAEEPKILNLMEALKKSVAAAQTGITEPVADAGEKKMAPSARVRGGDSAKKKSG